MNNTTNQVQTVFAAPPPGTCWGSPTTFIALLNTLVSSTFSEAGNLQFFNFGDNTPLPENRIYPWLKTVNGGVGGDAGWYVFKDGSWQLLNPPIEPPPPITWVGSTTGPANVYALSLPDYKDPLALVAGDIFVVKINVANTGASTLQVNSFAANPIKLNGAALVAAQMPASSWQLLEYDGTNFNLIATAKFAVSDIPPGTDQQTLRTINVLGTPTTMWQTNLFRTAGQAITGGAGPIAFGNIPTGLSAAPVSFQVMLRCLIAQYGWAVGDYVIPGCTGSAFLPQGTNGTGNIWYNSGGAATNILVPPGPGGGAGGIAAVATPNWNILAVCMI